MAAGYGGGLLACEPRDSLHLSPPAGCGLASPGRGQPPARMRHSSFGDDAELLSELPPNWTLRRFQDSVRAVLTEYFVSHALEDTVVAAQELLATCPSEADELGVVAIRAAVDRAKDAPVAVAKLLGSLSRSNSLDGTALVRSFEKIFCTIEDIRLDAPSAEKGVLQILEGCVADGAVDERLLTKLPESLLKAGLADKEGSNFSSEFSSMLAKTATEMKQFKVSAGRCLEEYFVAMNADEVGSILRELDMSAYHHEFVKKAITMSFSQSSVDASREAVMQLFAKLTSNGVLSKDDMQWGMTRLLGQLDDLALDNPRCGEMATEVLASALMDELISVPFFRRCRMLRIGDQIGLKVLEDVERRTPQYCKKHLGTAAFKREVKDMILEYFNSGDEAEFGRCIRELLPLASEQSAELVRKIMSFAMERTGKECEMALQLLVWISRNEELSPQDIEYGFDDMYNNMHDILLDVPDAEDMARTFVVEAKKKKVLRQSWPDEAEP
eukprot:TRINITY_DN67750_c0_g1_i1.p1 TRINITY_DN67750_c0_g1~~TRINITY_DN67750_c0_g1_i1.p1  ORF type:complete len:526 (-),score=126.69 TRINITY_DN67750_c0_g1_i1:137-1633(-)